MTHGRIAIFRGPGLPFDFEERPLPASLGAGELLVEILAATICGSDVKTANGLRREPTPSVLGHEGVGRVLDAGAGRPAGLLGARVTWTLADSCGACPACTTWDLPQKCRQLFKYGHALLGDSAAFTGCYASHILLRPGTQVFEVPEALSDEVAATANCALATVVAATERLPRPCRTAVVQGAGLLGLYAVSLLRSVGVDRVICVDIDPARLTFVRAFGGEPALGSAAGLCEAGGADVVLEVSGAPEVFREGLALLRPGGWYLLAGMVHPHSALEVTGEQIIRKCLTVRGSHNYAPRHLARALEFLAGQGRGLPWPALISPAHPLARLDAAFAEARTGRWARVAVRP